MYTLILIHIGHRWPHYLKDCIHQARQINPKETTEIILLVNGCHYQQVEELETKYSITPKYIEDLPVTKSHEQFLHIIGKLVDLQFRSKYWQYVFERFFIVEQYFLQLGESKPIYMIETDNLVYIPLSEVAKTESMFSQDMALPFDSLKRGYPSFIFFRNKQAVTIWANYVLQSLQNGQSSDMEMLGTFRKDYPSEVFAYPVLPPECNTPPRERKSQVGHQASSAEGLFLTNTQFPFVFDAIVYGQAVGGIDPCNTGGRPSVGYRNESALYSIDEVHFQWKKCENLWKPYANTLPIVNLHIHSKALRCFVSDRNTVPIADYHPKELEIHLTNEWKV